MEKNMLKNSLRIGAVYTGAIIGAGFASGQELESFFLKYGPFSYLGVFLMGALFAIMGAKILLRIYSNDVHSFKEYFSPHFSSRVSSVLEGITFFFMACVFCVMSAGCGALFEQSLNISSIWGILFMQILCFIIFIRGTKGFVTLNTILVPIMFIGIFILSVFGILYKTSPTFFSLNRLTDNFIFSSFLYVSYNVLTLISVFLPLKKYIQSKKTALLGGIIGGCSLLIMALLIWLCLFLFHSEVAKLEIPFLYVAQKGGAFYEVLYFIILFLAMYTTGAANGFAILDRLGKHRIKNALFLCLLSFPLSLLGFSNLVEHLYAFFGYLGLGITLLVLIL